MTDDSSTIMPDVIGVQLDIALSDIADAGFEDDVEIDGGGTFGVIDESNWVVCDQSPAAGQPVTSAPVLTVDRSCPDATAEPEVTEPEPTDPVSTTTEPETAPTQPESAPAELPTPTTEPLPEENITTENNPEFAALLAGDLGDCADAIGDFATMYRGRNVEFDGNVADWGPHGDYDTRYDFLIWGGDYSLEPLLYFGPSMKFEDVNRFDLNLIGDNVPDGVSEGDNFHIVAEVVEFRSEQCLLILDPVSMELR